MAKLPGNVLKTTGFSFRDSQVRVKEKPLDMKKMFQMQSYYISLSHDKCLKWFSWTWPSTKSRLSQKTFWALGNHNVPEWRNTLFWMWSAQIIIKLDVQCSFYNLLCVLLDFKKISCIRESMLSGHHNIWNLVPEWRFWFWKGCTVKQDIWLL